MTVDLRGFGALAVADWTVLRHSDLHAVNTESAPDTVAPVKGAGAAVDEGRLTAVLEPASWNVLRLTRP